MANLFLRNMSEYMNEDLVSHETWEREFDRNCKISDSILKDMHKLQRKIRKANLGVRYYDDTHYRTFDGVSKDFAKMIDNFVHKYQN